MAAKNKGQGRKRGGKRFDNKLIRFKEKKKTATCSFSLC
jgi:hypothetical protein